MTNRVVNTGGTATQNMTHLSHLGAVVTGVDGDAGYTTTAAAKLASSAGDNIYFDDANGGTSWGTLTYGIALSFFVILSVMHDGTEAGVGVTISSLSIMSGADMIVVGFRFQHYLRCSAGTLDTYALKFSGYNANVHYDGGSGQLTARCCIGYHDTGNNGTLFIYGDFFYCTAISISGASGSHWGFYGGTQHGCISLGFPAGKCFASHTPIGIGANMSSDTTASGSTKWHSVTPTAIVKSVTSGSADGHWLSYAVATLYRGTDYNATFDNDIDNDGVRAEWQIGADEVAGAGDPPDEQLTFMTGVRVA